MVCIYCGHDTQVTNSRPQKRLNQVWRRRHCPNCSATFSTEERTVYDEVWRVKTETGALAPFRQNKLLLSLYKSLEHRTHALEDATALVNTIIGLLRTQTEHGLLEATNISITASEVLNNFDKAAAVHYQAFHPR